MTNRPPLRRVLLVGFMGAGKTTVGEALARAMGWRFCDFDEEVERLTQATVAEVFDRLGESGFREIEARAARALLAESDLVIASGGGWAGAPGWSAAVPEGTAVVWLEVGPQEAVRRATAEPKRRPLLEGPDPLIRARELLERRAPHYADADWRVDTERSSVEDVTARILEILRTPGWESKTE